MGYLTNQTVIKTVDQETGEIYEKTTSKIYRIRTTPDEFFMMFVKAVDFESKLTSTDIKLLLQLAKHMSRDTNIVFINKYLKTKIGEIINVGYSAISNSIASLKKKGVLLHEEVGTYRINPHFAWKGNLKTREEIINELKIEFIIEGETPDIVEEPRSIYGITDNLI